MAKKQNPKNYALIAQLAEQLKVDLKDAQFAVTTPNKEAKARFHDGSLEVTLLPLNRPTVKIDSPRAPSIVVEMVDHQRDSLAPKEAIYVITACMPNPSDGRNYFLNGDVYDIFVGKGGIILSDSGRKRVAELLEKGNGERQ
jgi:hypothetical protein